VRKTYIHGIPYAEARALGPQAVPTLVRILSDPDQEMHWANAAVVLGLVGGDEAVAPLISFIRRGADRLSDIGYKAKTSAVIALGYAANGSSQPVALQFLSDGLGPGGWRALNWYPPGGDTALRDDALAEASILGLALSGRPEAVAPLRAVAKPSLLPLAQRALREHETVRHLGLAEYDRRVKARVRHEP
jgi:HEAT repeat protein